jgi:hypothetical protein
LAASSGRTPRILTRGETTQFQVGFFADEAKTQPLVPLDPTFPTATIYDMHNVVIQTGVGTQITPGNWVYNFLVPKDAPLTYFQQAPQTYNDEGQGAPLTADTSGRYRIEWSMLTGENYQLDFVEEFDVQDIAVTQSLSRELKYLTLARRPVKLFLRSTYLPVYTTLRVQIRGHDHRDHAIVDEFLDLSNPLQPAGNVQFRKDGDSYVLYYDLEEDITRPNTAYVILWELKPSEFSVPVTEYQILTAISTNVLPLMTALRMLIDRFQKRIGRIQAYEDSDLLEYLAQGHRLVNLSHPATHYNMEQMPDDFQSLTLLASGWYGLQAQKILQTELSFNFSGQSVTLSVDQMAGLDNAANSMMEMFNKTILPAKMAYVRRARGVGTVATRAYNYRNMYNYVYRISSIGSDALLNTLTKIGLL